MMGFGCLTGNFATVVSRDKPMADLIDVHAHLADPAFAADLAQVLDRARRAGVRRVVTVGETLDDAQRILALARQFPQIAPCAGLYPTHLDREQAAAIAAFIRAHAGELVAIGEIGLDRWMVQDPAQLELQYELFADQVRLAIEVDLPVNVHSRSAGHHTITALRALGARRVLMHAYDGRAGGALEGCAAGYYFSVPPSIVRSPQKQKLVRALPLDRLLLETDSPVLGAQPQQRNEPAQITVALAAVAELKAVEVERVAEITTHNARALFGERLSW
jgi:TatD DNase family protein